MLLLGQADAASSDTAQPVWQVLLDNGLLLVLLFIFLTAIIGVVVKIWQRDKCLKLFRKYHTSYLTTDGRCFWGDLTVYSAGLELRFDQPYTNSRGLVKSSAMVYQPELEATGLVICRVAAAQDQNQRRCRQKQARKLHRPGLWRRLVRKFRNLINTLRDAFSKAISAIVGAVAKSRPGSAVLNQQQGAVSDIGTTLLGAAGNAYEPILEAHIGRPVVVQVAGAGEGTPAVELPGFLAEYTDKFLAIMNLEHDEDLQRDPLTVTQTTDTDRYTVTLDSESVKITNKSPDVLVVKDLQSGGRRYDLAVPLIRGGTLTLHRPKDQPVELAVAFTRGVDVVVPRARATIHFGGDEPRPASRWSWRQGIAPIFASEEAADETDPEQVEPKPA